MRVLRPVFALSLAVALAACGQQAAPPPVAAPQPAGPPPVDASATAIRGQVMIDGQTTLPPRGVELRLRLLDMTDPSIAPPVVAERVEPAPAGLPYRYALPYDAAQIDAERKYVIEASLLTAGVVLYGTPAPVAVLGQGAGDQAELRLTRGGTAAADVAPADLLWQEFEALETASGGMRRLVGERTEGDVMIGWDAFAEDRDVRLARENVDYGDAGSASFRFAYKGGNPWVVVREQGGVETRLGWNDAGEVLLNRKGDEALDEAEIAQLREQSERLYRIVKARADRD